MARIYENRYFDGLKSNDASKVFEDLEFRKCDFASCNFSMDTDPKLRNTVRRVRLEQCRVRASFLGDPILDEVEVHGLDTGVNFCLESSGAVFRHVVLSGKIGGIMLKEGVGLLQPKKEKEAFAAANAKFYQHVDWALDISQAEFYQCSVMGVPYQLIRRDPETQVVVKRASALEVPWSELDVDPYWKYCLDLLVRGDKEGIVLVAFKGHPNFREYLRGLQRLRQVGIAEAD